MRDYHLMQDSEIMFLLWNLLHPISFDWAADTLYKLPYSSSKGGVPITLSEIRKILMSSDGTEESERSRLLEYYYNYQFNKEPKEETGNCKEHLWIDVTLFNVSHKRCAKCDIKQTSMEEK